MIECKSETHTRYIYIIFTHLRNKTFSLFSIRVRPILAMISGGNVIQRRILPGVVRSKSLLGRSSYRFLSTRRSRYHGFLSMSVARPRKPVCVFCTHAQTPENLVSCLSRRNHARYRKAYRALSACNRT